MNAKFENLGMLHMLHNLYSTHLQFPENEIQIGNAQLDNCQDSWKQSPLQHDSNHFNQSSRFHNQNASDAETVSVLDQETPPHLPSPSVPPCLNT